MKKLAVTIAAICASISSVNPAIADVNRQVERINVRAYRNVMRTNYPSPLAQHFRLMSGDLRQFVNTNVLTKDNADLARDLIIKSILAEAASPDAMSQAQRAAVVDSGLRSTRARTESILKDLKIAIPEPIGSETQTNIPTDTKKDYSHFNETIE